MTTGGRQSIIYNLKNGAESPAFKPPSREIKHDRDSRPSAIYIPIAASSFITWLSGRVCSLSFTARQALYEPGLCEGTFCCMFPTDGSKEEPPSLFGEGLSCVT